MRPDTANSAYGYLAKITPIQNVLWEKVYPFNYQETDAINDAIQLPSGEIIAAGQYFNKESPDYYEAFLLKTDENGEEVWRRTYKGREGAHTYVFDMEKTADNGFAICGYVYPDGVNSQDGWLLKVDSMGCLVEGCGNTGFMEITDNENGELFIYPNPASFQFTIENSQLEIGDLRIINVLGEEVYRKTISSYATNIDVFNLKNGVYFVTFGNKQAKLIVSH